MHACAATQPSSVRVMAPVHPGASRGYIMMLQKSKLCSEVRPPSSLHCHFQSSPTRVMFTAKWDAASGCFCSCARPRAWRSSWAMFPAPLQPAAVICVAAAPLVSILQLPHSRPPMVRGASSSARNVMPVASVTMAMPALMMSSSGGQDAL